MGKQIFFFLKKFKLIVEKLLSSPTNIVLLNDHHIASSGQHSLVEIVSLKKLKVNTI